MEKAFANVTVEEWVNAIRHTEKVEEEHWRMNFLHKMPTTPPLYYHSRSPRGFRNRARNFDEDSK